MNKYFKENLLIFLNYLFFFILLFIIYNFDISQFAQFSQFTDKDRIPFKINPIDSTGYDGQFYVRLALNPFELDWSHDNLPEGNLSYRYSRIGFPLILWMFSFFIQEYIIYVSIFINIFGILLIYEINKHNFQLLNINKKYAIFVAFLPGYYFVISRITSEIYEIVFISLALLFFLRKRFFLFSVFTLFAILIRETAIIFYVIIFTYCLLNKYYRTKIHIFIIPAIGFLLWQIFLFISFTKIPFGTGANVNFSLPFRGIIEIFYLPRYQNNILQGLTYIFEYFFILSICFLCFYKIKKENFYDFVFLSFIAYFIFFLILNEVVLGTDWGFMRILLELSYFSTIFVLKLRYIKINYLVLTYVSINFFVILRIIVEQYLKYKYI